MKAFFQSLCLLLVLVCSGPVWAQSTYDYPAEIEERARDVGKQLRCVVCQNQSIEESDAELAADMRFVVRERLVAGDSNEEVIAIMRDRYGDYVLLKPPVQGNTFVLWGAPFFLLIAFVIWWIRASTNRRHTAADIALSDEEISRLETLRKQSQ